MSPKFLLKLLLKYRFQSPAARMGSAGAYFCGRLEQGVEVGSVVLPLAHLAVVIVSSYLPEGSTSYLVASIMMTVAVVLGYVFVLVAVRRRLGAAWLLLGAIPAGGTAGWALLAAGRALQAGITASTVTFALCGIAVVLAAIYHAFALIKYMENMEEQEEMEEAEMVREAEKAAVRGH